MTVLRCMIWNDGANLKAHLTVDGQHTNICLKDGLEPPVSGETKKAICDFMRNLRALEMSVSDE